MIVYSTSIHRKLYDGKPIDVRSRQIRFCLENDDFTRELVSSIGERGEGDKRILDWIDVDEDTRAAE
jgi:hypothetical protein